VGDGSAIRDYVHVSDVVEAATRIVAGALPVGIVNVGSGCGESVLGLARMVGEVIGVQPILNFIPPRRHDVKSIVLDIGKLASFIDYHPLGLRQGLQLTWHHMMGGQLAAARVAHSPVVHLAEEAFGVGPADAAS
jgi:nucleoside-diphosphate-sugar epimerase